MPKKKAPLKAQSIFVKKIQPLYTVLIICVASLLFLISVSSLFYNFSSHPNVPENEGTTPVPKPHLKVTLPKFWQELTPENEGILYKAERVSDNSIKPTVVAVLTPVDESNSKLYTDQLIKGTQSTIPSFRILQNTITNKNNMFIRQVTGYYLNASKRVDIIQTFYIYKGELLTLTSSTDPKETKALQPEIQAIFDSISAAKSFPKW